MRRWLPSALLLGLVVATFAPTLGHGFVWDDELLLTGNPRFAQPPELGGWMLVSTHAGHWMPLTWLSYALDARLAGGLDARLMRAHNIAWHALAALLLAWLIAELLALVRGEPRASDAWLSAALAAAWAVHPLRVESVVWITERRDVLSGALLIGASLAWLRGCHGPSRGRSATALRLLAIVLFALAAGAKAWGMLLPPALWLSDLALARWRGAGRPAPCRVQRWAPLAVMALLSLPLAWLAVQAQAGAEALRSWEAHPAEARLRQSLYGSIYYLAQTALPRQLSPLRELDPRPGWRGEELAAGLALLGLLALAGWRARRGGGLWLPLLLYLCLIAPVLGWAQSGPQRVADRYAYLATIPWFAAAALWLREPLARAPRRWGAALAVAIALLAIGNLRYARHWRSELTLWQRAVAVEPASPLAQANLGFAHRQLGRQALAAGDRRRGAEHYRLAAEALQRSRQLALRQRPR